MKQSVHNTQINQQISALLNSVADDLLTTGPLIGRTIRRKVLRMALTECEEEITLPHVEIIRLLYEAGTLHIADISERLQIARPQMTHLLDKLVNQGVVERQTGTADRRMIHIRLTTKGEQMVKEHDSRIKLATMEALASLCGEELSELSGALKTLRDTFSRLS